MKYYFAYGYDLNGEEFEKNCPSLQKIASAKLEDYDFFVDSFGKPNIKKSVRDCVYGGIWKISDSDFKRLENKSDSLCVLPSIKIEKYFCEEIIPNNAEIFTVIKKSKELGICTDSSLQDLFYGALDFGLPETYLEFTQRFYAKHIFISSKLLSGYDNDYIMDKLNLKKVDIAYSCSKYARQKNERDVLINNISDDGLSIRGIVYSFNDIKLLDFFDGIFANRKFFRRYPIRVRTIQEEVIWAWCYFKEESLNLGIIEIME